MSLRKVAVCIASSNTGSACVRSLLEGQKVAVRAVFRSHEKAGTAITSLNSLKLLDGSGTNPEVVTGVDAYNTDTLSKAFEGCETAVVVTPHDVTRGFRDDSKLTLNMIDAAVNEGVKHIVYIGSWTVYEPKDLNMIADRFIPAEKRLVELAKVHKHTHTFSCLRSGFFNPNLVNMFGSLRKGNTLRFPAEISFPPVDPRDVGKAAAALAEHAPETRTHKKNAGKVQFYDISGPAMLQTHEMAAIFAQGLERPEIRLAEDAVDVDAYAAPLPPALQQLMYYMSKRGSTAVPISDDVRKITGTQAASLLEWVKEHKHMFDMDEEQ